VIDHISIVVSDLERSAAFYRAVLEPLGMKQLIQQPSQVDGAITFGFDDADDFAILPAGEVEPTRTVHIAFTATSVEEVNAFHAAAIAAGARERIAPSVRAEYSPSYYGAFVDDPDGNNIEAVYHAADADELEELL
jgi:catechol 2,3-dioxygenase-like lactoylglutathione lyase family enzyme